ncbi:hypothetical protein E5CHR_02608 [Variovorax sp. PBL-E5]|nr:hypothetical protein E5CHR_02608 [Variovorax sp. PBL-E5]
MRYVALVPATPPVMARHPNTRFSPERGQPKKESND